MSYESAPPPPPGGGQPPTGGGQPPYGGGQPPYGGGQPPYGGGQPPYGTAPTTNQKAIWALVLGILGLLCFGLVAGIPAIILGRSARREIEASGGTQSGGGMGTAGFVLGILATAWSVIWLIIVVIGLIAGGNN